MRILIVDDESINRFLLVHMLEEDGLLDVYEARSGHEAIVLASKIQPDIVLLDVVMPDLSGFDVARELKNTNDNVYLPIIFITSLDDEETIAKCLDVGGDDFVSKPFNKTVLLAKVRAHARTRELSKKAELQNKELTYFRHSIEREHEIIEHIFSQAIVNNPLVTRYFDYRLFPAAEFSGDVFLCEASPNGGLYFLIGDFTGHGLASAIGALPVTKAFQAMATKGLSVSEIASTLNTTLESLLPINMFFAAAIVEVSENGCRLNVWNGGMPNLLLQSPTGELVTKFGSQHMALGILQADEFDDKDEVYSTEPGSRLLAFTDGLIEITNAEGEMFGEEGIERWFVGNPSVSVEELMAPLKQFLGGNEPHDDITLTMFTCQALTSLRRNQPVTALPFSVSATLHHNELKQGEGVQHFIELICSQRGLSWIRSDLFTILTELYSNALEHGVLGMDSSMKRTSEGFMAYYEQREQNLADLQSGYIELRAEFDVGERLLTVHVTDSGEGFDSLALEKVPSDETYGRGISMLRELCETLTFIDNGRHAVARIPV
ncbi:ATP-binding SpoIIE family protein phosphatase [Alteromonas oceanisediminis]|uniref:ATP-binding SpoIIE family protein phosphatase n=1 Tax=Alteromonas oceanisediminis TaxID=2836180 RepID=UPI001BD9A538|nr:SpoIIE family protein phosphatase [Alteromonas oceanisediminis]MBT0587546.1 SpoIIE family protein phosphatase [Alteromonas oceanisediminis]